MALVGRSVEIEALERLLSGLSRGESAVLVLEGEPGMGKTALLEEVMARARHCRVLMARGIESEVDLAYGALGQLLAPSLLTEDAADRVVRAAVTVSPDRHAGFPDRFMVASATLAVLSRSAEQGPLLVILDDAQWMDTPSVDVVCFVARRLHAEGVLLLLARRPGEGAAGLDGLPRLVLAGLTAPAARELLRSAGAQGLAAARLEPLVDMTGGNPLALVELPRLVDTAALAGDAYRHAPLPMSVALSRAYERDLTSLPDAGQQAVLIAAVLDRPDLWVVDRALGRAGLTIQDLLPAEAVGMLRFTDDQITFRHPLVRAAVVGSAPAALRRAAHAAAAAALSESPASADGTRRAWHRASAVVGVDEAAATELDQVAAASVRVAGFASAAAAYERAGKLSPDPADRRRRLLAAADSAYQAGMTAWSGRLLRALDDGSRDVPDPATVRLQARVDLWEGRAPRAIAELTAAAAIWGPSDSPAAALLWLDAAVAAAWTGDTAAAVRAAAQACRRAAGRGVFLETVTRAFLGGTHLFRGESADGLPMLPGADRLLLGGSVADPSLLPYLAVLGFLHVLVDDLDEATRLISAAVDGARRHGATGALSFALGQLAIVENRRGAWDTSYALAHEALSLAVDTGRSTETDHALVALAAVEAGRGQAEDCRRHVAQSTARAAAAGNLATQAQGLSRLGLLELGLGDLPAATACLQECQAICEQQGLLELTHVQWAVELVECHVRSGRAPDAEPAMSRLRWHAHRTQRPLARAWSARGEALLAATDEDYERQFTEALRWHALAPRPFERARTELLFGERLRRSKRRSQARGQLLAALQTFTELGAAPWSARARQELAASGVTLTPPRALPTDSLTPQELQIALAVADGITNRDIAARLFLSTKTVSYHLTRIYRKLGCQSREALAAAINHPSHRV